MASDGWQECSVADVAASVRNALVGGPFGSNLVSSDYTHDGVPVIRGQNMGLGRWVEGDFAFVSPQKAASLSANLARPGDLIFTQRGTLGQVALVPTQPFEKYVISQSQMKLTVDAKMADAVFLYYVFLSAEQQDYIRRSAIQTGVPHTNLGILRETPLLLPSLPEQRAIAHILGTLDDKIELNRQMNKTLEATARAIFKSWFVDFEPIPGIGLHKEWEDSPLGRIPKGWQVLTLGKSVALIIDYRGKTPGKLGRSWASMGIPAVSAKNIKGGRLVRRDTLKYVDEELLYLWMKDKLAIGDILLTSEAPLGELMYLALNADFCLSQRVFAVRADPSICNSSYLYYWLLTDQAQAELQARATGTTVVGIRQSELRKINVLIPPISCQNYALSLFKSILERVHLNEESNETLASIRDTLLPKLLSGEIRIRDAERIVGKEAL